MKMTYILILAMVAFSSCSKQSSDATPAAVPAVGPAQTPEQIQNAQAVNDYFMSLSTWDKLSVAQTREEDGDAVPAGPSRTEKRKGNVVTQQKPQTCTVQDFDLNKTPSKIVMQNPAAGILYPGALIQGKGYLQGPGGLRELPIRQRAPISITLDLGGSSRIENLDYSSYQDAYYKLVQDAMARGAAIPANIAFTKKEAFSSEQAALDLGFSVKYLGNSLKGSVKGSSSVQKSTFMVVLEQRAFTISAVAPSSPAEYFTSDFSDKDLQLQQELGNIGPDNPPVYVSSVNYGRILMFTVTSTADKKDLEAALNGTYSDYVTTEVEASVKTKYQKIMNESTVQVISIGGATKQVEDLIKSGNYKDYFAGAPSLDSYVPVSYVFRNILDNSIAKVGETTRYSNVECIDNEVKAWKVRISIEGMNVRHGFSDYNNAFVYGQIALDNKLVWNNKDKGQYIKIKKDSLYKIGADKGVIETILPVAADKTKAIPLMVNLRENLAPLALWWRIGAAQLLIGNLPLATINEERLGYSLDGRVLGEDENDNTYTLKTENVEILYKVKRLDPIFE